TGNFIPLVPKVLHRNRCFESRGRYSRTKFSRPLLEENIPFYVSSLFVPPVTRHCSPHKNQPAKLHVSFISVNRGISKRRTLTNCPA
ncbi:hypothetical protein L9F63_019562, partial [Diploptera punctata]